MNTIQKVFKNILTALLVTVGICLLALLIEAGIFLTDWFHAGHSLPTPWNKHKSEARTKETLTGYAGISHLSVSCDNYTLTIKTDDQVKDVRVSYEKNTGRVSVWSEGDTLYVEQKNTHNLYNLLHPKNKLSISPGKIEILIPKNFTFEKTNLSLDSGDATLEQFSAGILTLTNTSGVLQCAGTFAKEAVITTGSGDTTLENVTFDTLTAQTASGALTCSGHFSSYCDFQIGSGDATLLFYAPRTYYGLQITKGEGTILIDGENYEDVPLSENAAHTISLKNETGNCSLIFQSQN